ncbi:hypothetical protein [Pelagibacterium lentulum]|uniref:Uncharacterized protein n=2 Tax=Pelagibacterium lentulum TaxID=2029865 RepID=A0A916VZ72_9HYPH|nr:hypothetical protein [Pelagibacterium lentulum]GGA53771.1 hypothetical protein GCM10011499_24820 [Pelagibacterium lentulum]
MTPEHFIFIPTIFLLGLLTGALLTSRRATGLPVLLTLGIALGTFALTHLTNLPFGARAVHIALDGLPLFDQSPSFSANEVLARLELFSEQGRAVYQFATYTGDVIFPLSLLAFFLALAHFTAQQLQPAAWLRLLYALPLVWFAADMVENAMIYSLIAGLPTPPAALAAVLGPVTTFKLALLPASILVPLLVLGLSHLRSARVKA